MSVELVIFDCDGVLVDSETLQHRVLVEVIAELGLVMSVAEAVRLFQGGKMADCLRVLEERLGRALPTNFETDLRACTMCRFQQELQAVPGVVAALERIALPCCVASSGPRAKIESSLQITGLLPHFAGRIFSAYDIHSWKPDPDLFLHAAHSLGVAPTACVVVEDSVLGVRAGMAAGMKVLGYAGEGDGAELMKHGAYVFTAMADLPELLMG